MSHNTAKAWLSVLEASFIVFRIPAWHRNLRKQLVKTAKLHFVDTGLACHLLGIRDVAQLAYHPLRGALFESWVASEILKQRLHAGRPAHLFHFRESRGTEVDLIVEDGARRIIVEVKSAQTVTPGFFANLEKFSGLIPENDGLKTLARLVYGGDQAHQRKGTAVLGWQQVPDIEW